MITQGSFAAISEDWHIRLSSLYPQNEISVMFRIVLEDVFGLSKSEQITVKQLVQPEEIREAMERILTRLLTSEPLQHIIGFAWFDDLKIGVSPDVLVPRSETEELVYQVVTSLPADFHGSIVDWCTGSGCIALALKKHFPHAKITGYDLSECALAIASENAEMLGLEVGFEKKDALLNEPYSVKSDVIISNPPYIPETEKQSMHPNVTLYEPGIALFVPDQDPLLFYKAITQKAMAELNPGGFLFFELHESFAKETQEMVVAAGRFKTVDIIEDLQGKSRMLRAVLA